MPRGLVKAALGSLCLFLLIATSTHAQNHILQKLPLFPDRQDILINGLAKDSLGFVWFLHNSEIYRYDGYRSLNVSRTIPGYDVLNDTPQKILVDKQNRLWIAGRERIRYLDLKTWKINHLGNSFVSASHDRTVLWIKEMPDGAVITAYHNGYLVLFKDGKVTLIKVLYEKSVKSNIPVLPQSCTFWKGQYRIGTSEGAIFSINPQKGNKTTYLILPAVHQTISNLIALDNRLLIDVPNQGLFALDEGGKLTTEKIAGIKFREDFKHVFQEGPLHHVYADAEHIYVFDKNMSILQTIDVTIGHQYALVDKNEIILGADDGVYILYEKPPGLSELATCNTDRKKSVRGLYVFKDGGIFLGSYGGAGYIDVSGQCHAIDNIKNAYCILPLNDSELLIGTEGGFLKVFDRRTLAIRNHPFILHDEVENKFPHNFPSSVLSLAQTTEHYLIGSTKGLWSMDKVTLKLHPIEIKLDGISVPNLQIRQILESGTAWLVSTQLGLYKVEKDGRAKKLFPTQGSIGTYKTVLSRDTLWLATQGKGLVAIDKNGSILKSWTQSEGLSANTVFSLEIVNGFIMAGTADGLSLIQNGRIRRITEKEGLIHAEFNSAASYWDAPRRRVYMGGIKGYTILETNKLQIMSKVAQSYVTELHIASSSHPYTKKDFTRPYAGNGMIELNSDESIVGLYMGSPAHYRTNVAIQYSFKDGGWQTLQPSQFISLIEPSPGLYPIHFETTGSGLDVGPSAIWIQKLPNFYETWWFIMLMVLMPIAAVALWYRNKFLKVEREQQIRNGIAEDLHDEVGGLLTGISMQVELLRMKDQHSANQRHVMQLSTLSKEVLQSMNDVVWSLNSRNDSWRSLLDKLMDFGKHLFEASTADFSMQITGTVPDKLSQQERQTVYLLIRELLNNACKHARATNVVLTFTFDKHITVTVSDDGCGFDTDSRYSGNGIKNMRNRALSIHGNLDIRSSSAGSTVCLHYTPKV